MTARRWALSKASANERRTAYPYGFGKAARRAMLLALRMSIKHDARDALATTQCVATHSPIPGSLMAQHKGPFTM